MSTKIYNTFKFNGETEELISILKEIKLSYYQYLKNFLTNLNLNWDLKKERYKFLEKDYSWKEFKELDFSDYLLEDILATEKKRGEHHPFNIDASAVVYFCENKQYVQFFGLPQDFQKLILDKYNDKFQDYHYQNNTDQSNYDWDTEPWDEMSEERQEELEKEWEERYRIWEKIMPDYSIPSESGLIFEFAPIGYQLHLLCNVVLDTIK